MAIKKRSLVQKGEERLVSIDASGRPLGRVASEAAMYLLGKKSVAFVKNEIAPVRVTITNVSKISISEKKMKEKSYLSYTGYPGGLNSLTMTQLISKKGLKEVVEKAVDGMLPRNKLRKERMKRLTITN
jgi:large subunit ribosomal protein L13